MLPGTFREQAMPTLKPTIRKPVSAKALAMRRYREKMRAAGMRPVQIWVPDLRDSSFASTYRRQVLQLWQSAAERADFEFMAAVQDWRE